MSNSKVLNKKNTMLIAMAGMFMALEFIFERYLSISTPIVRISFTFIPRALAGMCVGIVLAGLASLLADIVGAIIFYGASINPMISLAALCSGLILAWLYKKGKPGIVKISTAAILDQFFCGLLLTSLGLIWFGGGPNALEFWITRVTKCAIMAAVEIPVLILCTKAIYPLLRSFLNRNGLKVS